MPPRSRPAGPLALAGALAALFSLSAGAAQAQVTLTPTVTTNGALFNYTYSVADLSSADLAIIDLSGLPQMDGAITNLSAPTGYQISPFDSVNGLVSFLPGDQTFAAGGTVSGFSFSSTFAPATTVFDAFDSNGVMYTGTTLAPAALPVPEAGTVVSFGALLALGGLVLLRRKSAVRS